MKVVPLVIAALTLLTGSAAFAQAGAERAMPELETRAPSCEQILAPHEGAGGHGEVNISDAIFHHVTDSHALEFEAPFSGATVHVDLKKTMCQVFGWNGVLEVGGNHIDFTPTKHLVYLWLAALLLLALAIGAAPKKGQITSKGFGSVVETLVLFVRDEIAKKTIGEAQAARYTPYLVTAFFFILVMNLLGLLPYSATATGNISVTAGLAICTFLVTQYAGIRSAGLKGYLAHLTGGLPWPLWPIIIPVEILGLFTKPFALAIRLFANMAAGHIIIYFLIALIFILKTAFVAPVSVAFAMGIYLLELFVALVQAYVFTMLSSLFIGLGEAMGHHDHGEDAHQQAGGDHGHVVQHDG